MSRLYIRCATCNDKAYLCVREPVSGEEIKSDNFRHLDGSLVIPHSRIQCGTCGSDRVFEKTPGEPGNMKKNFILEPEEGDE